MSQQEMQQRQADSFSRRRRLLDKEGKKAFDDYYGKQQHGGSMGGKPNTGAGKGDKPRPVHKQRYDIGLRLATESLSPEERKELEREWYRLGGQQHPDDQGTAESD